MSCSEARDVIGAVTIHNDKLKVLDTLKRLDVHMHHAFTHKHNLFKNYMYKPFNGYILLLIATNAHL